MKSSELFSHLQTPQVTVRESVSNEPVKPLEFSDQPRTNRSGDSPSQ